MFKSDWQTKMEELIDNASEAEFQDFLKRTNFEFYNQIKTPVLDYLDAVDNSYPIESE